MMNWGHWKKATTKEAAVKPVAWNIARSHRRCSSRQREDKRGSKTPRELSDQKESQVIGILCRLSAVSCAAFQVPSCYDVLSTCRYRRSAFIVKFLVPLPFSILIR